MLGMLLIASRHVILCYHRDNEQITPLMQAAMDGDEIIVELLIAYVSVSSLPPSVADLVDFL